MNNYKENNEVQSNGQKIMKIFFLSVIVLTFTNAASAQPTGNAIGHKPYHMNPMMEDHIKTMRLAAIEVKTTNEDLSTKLSMMADMKENMRLGKDKTAMSYNEMQQSQLDHTAAMREAASALISSNPALSEKLTKMADMQENVIQADGQINAMNNE